MLKFQVNQKETDGDRAIQLIWKITPKIISGTSILLEVAAHVAACTFDEGCFVPAGLYEWYVTVKAQIS